MQLFSTILLVLHSVLTKYNLPWVFTATVSHRWDQKLVDDSKDKITTTTTRPYTMTVSKETVQVGNNISKSEQS